MTGADIFVPRLSPGTTETKWSSPKFRPLFVVEEEDLFERHAEHPGDF